MRIHAVPLWFLPVLLAWLTPRSIAWASCAAPFECACDEFWDAVVVGDVLTTSAAHEFWSQVEIEVTGKAVAGQGVIEQSEPETAVAAAHRSHEVSVGDFVIADATGNGGYQVRLIAGADGRFSCEGTALSVDELLAFAPDCVGQMEDRTGQSYVCDDHDSDTACLASVAGAPNAPSLAVVLTGMTLLGLGVRRARGRSNGSSSRAQAS